MTCARQRTYWLLLSNWICFLERSVATAWRNVILLLALSVVTPRIYIKDYFKNFFFYFSLNYLIYQKKKLTLNSMLKLLKLLRKASLILIPVWGPSSLIKSRRRLFSSHLSDIQCAVMPKKDIQFDDVQASIVNDILDVFYKN